SGSGMSYMALEFWPAARGKKGAYPRYVTLFATQRAGKRTSRIAQLFLGKALACGADRALQELRHMLAEADHGCGGCRRQKLAVVARHTAAVLAGAAGVAVEGTHLRLLLLLLLRAR